MYLWLSWSCCSAANLCLLFTTPRTAACQASLSFTFSWKLLKLMSIESVIPSNHLILCCPLFLPPSIFPSIRGFSNESVFCIRWPKYWSFSFNISANVYSGLISLGLTGLTSLLSKDCQESSPAPQLKGINSSALSLFYCPALMSIHNYWENHNFDYTDLYRQSKTPLQNSKSPNRGPLLVVFINVDSILIIVPGT